jgi:hypothetical protein
MCAIVNEVPADTICQECLRTNKSGRVPPSIILCGLKFHRKPVVADVMEAMENWIPGFQAASLGVPISINWLQINHSIISNRQTNWSIEQNEEYLVYNTQTGTTRKVQSSDRIVATSDQCACYIMQHLNIAGERVLTFYDSGANNNIVEYRLARDAEFHQIGRNPVSFNVAGGGSIRSDYSQYAAILGPDVNGDFHDVECQAVDRITSEFPRFKLKEVIAEAKPMVGDNQIFPLETGGGVVRLLIGIRSTQLAPTLRMSLPSGLCVYEYKFRDVYGVTLCFGGPHEVFTQSYKAAGFDVTNGTVQVLLNEIASAYEKAPRTFVSNPPTPAIGDADSVDAPHDLVIGDAVAAADNTGPEGVDTHIQILEEVLSESVANNDMTPDSGLLAGDQGTSVLDPQDISIHEQDSGASLLVPVGDGVTDFDGLPRESNLGTSVFGLGDGLNRSESMGELEVSNAGETQVADPSADDPSLKAVLASDQPQEDPSLRTEKQLEEPQSVHAIKLAQSRPDLPPPDKPLLIAVVKELQGECHVKPEHCPEESLDESQAKLTSTPIVLMHKGQQTTLEDESPNRDVDATDCSIQTDATSPTDYKTTGSSCPGHPIDVSQRKEIEDLKKQIVRLEGALMRAAVNCNAEAKAVKSKTKTELAELRRRVYDQEDTIEELWERVAKGMIGPPKIHAESQTRKEDVAEAATTAVNVNTGGRTVEA